MGRAGARLGELDGPRGSRTGPDVPVQVGPQMTIVQNDLVYGAPKMTHALDSEGVGGEFDAPPALLRGLDHEFN